MIHWLLRYISTHNFLPFVIYRLALAVVVAVLLLTGFLEPLPGPEPLGGNEGPAELSSCRPRHLARGLLPPPGCGRTAS